MGDLTDNFDASEFVCPCPVCIDAPRVEISKHLVDLLQGIRNHTGIIMRVNSGVRCEAHNKAIGGSPKSSHLIGLAADIAFKDTNQAFELLQAGFDAGFRRMGKYKTFIHFDVDGAKAQDRLW